MTRSVLSAATLSLALATALTLLALAAMLPAPPANADAGAVTAGVVRRFYAAVNHAVRTGDAAALEAVVADSLGVYGPGSDRYGPGLEGLRRRLDALHAAEPALRIDVRSVVADGERAVAHVALDGLAPGAPLAVPTAAADGWTLTDRFGVADGRIVEYGGAVAGLAAPRALLETVLDRPPAGPVWVGLARFTLDPGAETPALVGPGPVAYAVESGTVTLRLDGQGRVTRATAAALPPRSEVVVRGQLALAPGDAVSIGRGVGHGARNDGAAPVSVLATAILPGSALQATDRPHAAAAPRIEGLPAFAPAVSPSIAMFATAEAEAGRGEWPDGVAVTPLAAERGNLTPPARSEGVAVAVGHLTVPPGAHVEARGGPVAALLAVASGAALVSTSALDGTGAITPPALLAAGEATVWEANSTTIEPVGARALTLTVVTVGPESPPATRSGRRAPRGGWRRRPVFPRLSGRRIGPRRRRNAVVSKADQVPDGFDHADRAVDSQATLSRRSPCLRGAPQESAANRGALPSRCARPVHRPAWGPSDRARPSTRVGAAPAASAARAGGTMPRRATLHLLTCALSLATAVALLGAAALVGAGPDPAPPVGTAEAVVRGFYAAVNHTLRTGDTAALEAVVVPGLTVYPPLPGATPDRAGLARYLAAVHAAFSGVRLVVEEVVAVGEQALARVAVRGAEPSFVGLRLSGGLRPWGRVDAFRMAGGRIVELWAGGDGLALLEPLQQRRIGAEISGRRGVRLERVTVPLGGRPRFGPSTASRLVAVVAGTVAIAVEPASPTSVLAFVAGGDGERRPTEVGPGAERTLVAGDAAVIPAPTRYTLRGGGERPAPVLVAVAFPITSAGPVQPSQAVVPRDVGVEAADGAVVEPLAGGLATTLPGAVDVAFGRMTLAPGAVLSARGAAGPVLLAVEAGALGLEATGGEASVRRGADGTGTNEEVGSLAAGDGAFVPAGASLTLRALGDEPAAVLAVTVLPAAAQNAS